MNEIVRGLLNRNLLVRTENARGARMNPLSFSPRGRILLKDAHQAVYEAEERMLEPLNRGARRDLLAALTKCAEALERRLHLKSEPVPIWLGVNR